MDPGHRFTIFDQMRVNDIFTHLDLGLNISNMGVGFQLSSPVTEWARLRAGVDFMPHFNVPMSFDIAAYSDGQVNPENFQRIKELMNELTGFNIDEQVDMTAKPNGVNFRLMVDIMPIPSNRNWHVTVGFLAGSSQIGKVKNDMHEMSSLLTMGLYNRFYDYLASGEYIDRPIIPSMDIYLDPEEAQQLFSKLEKYGHLGMHVGNFKDTGEPYMMEPNSEGLVKAKALVNHFKPYLGVGYNGPLGKNERFKIGFDAGVLFWGGAPNVITHDGVNLTTQVTGISGKVGDYMSLLRGMKVCPMVNFKISYTLF